MSSAFHPAVLQGYRALALNRAGALFADLAGREHLSCGAELWSLFGWPIMSDLRDFAALLIQTGALHYCGLVLPKPRRASGRLKGIFRERVTFFGVGLFTILWSMARERIIFGEWLTGTNLGFHLLFAAMSVVAMTSRSERVHAVLAVLMSGLFLLYIALLFARLD